MLRQKSSSPLGCIGRFATPDMNSRLFSLRAGTYYHNSSNCFPFVVSSLPEHVLLQATFVQGTTWTLNLSSQLVRIYCLQLCACAKYSCVSHLQTPRPKVCLACGSTKSVEPWFHGVAADQTHKLQSDLVGPTGGQDEVNMW